MAGLNRYQRNTSAAERQTLNCAPRVQVQDIGNALGSRHR
jgi:hypothetical protein